MEFIDRLFDAAPMAALFATVALGYLAGKLRIGRFVLGGIAGTLLVGVLIGQFGVKIEGDVRSIFFALFIYAVGYQGGPQFFHALNRHSLNQLISATLVCVTGLLSVLAAAWLFDLDRGLAAGLAAGGLTQSAIIGTATDAIAKLDVAPDLIKTMETNVAVGYAVCYIFGSLGPILLATWFLPMVMGWDVRAEAIKLAKSMSGDDSELEPGQFNALGDVDARLFRAEPGAAAVGKTVAQIEDEIPDLVVDGIVRDGQALELADQDAIEAGDCVTLAGHREVLERAGTIFGPEVAVPEGVLVVQENREIILTNRHLVGETLETLRRKLDPMARRGTILLKIRRMGRALPLLPKLQLRRGDELEFTGRPKALDKLESQIGFKISAAAVTDFVFFGGGMAIGILAGAIDFRIAGVPLTIGTGGGCLLAGLFFGWLRSVRPQFAALPTGASNFLMDFGLAAFVGIVGVTAGPAAITTIEQQGMTLFLLGVFVTLVPTIITFYISYYLLGIRNPIEALACMVGGRSANPGFAALLEKAGNPTPVVAFTVTYAVANVLLTLWGPVIVGIVTRNPAP